MSNVIIVGGHGKVAQLATPLLVEAGHKVTSIIRSADQEDAIKQLGATPLLLDIETSNQDDLAKAFAGQDAVVWAAGAGGGNPERTYAVDRDAAIASMDAAQGANALRYIMISYLGSSLDHGVDEDNSFFPYAQSKALADEHLMDSDLHWTILGPGMLTLEDPSNTIRRVGRMSNDSLDDSDSKDTSRANVANAIAAALSSDKTVNNIVEFVDGQTPIEDIFR
ncbi:MAG TPA: NAD(P)H-binding protein [Candidatus Yaniella excrementavium]|nr:NAD(P)H-binding protein [Candidatus Yaniella excrementavium]